MNAKDTATSRAPTWRERLQPDMPEALAKDIDTFETQLRLRRQGKIEEKLFAETRLRRGVYGQRYDNGQRHDGVATRALAFPCGELTKGPSTVWDAPGMMRIKIPMGRLLPEQLERVAELAEEYSDAILHVTTRQDLQLHYVHIDDTPDLMRRLAAVGVTTQEACGNSVRNVTACPRAGVCANERFDVTPTARALAYFLLGHDDTQDFGRKFKVAFSGCAASACALVSFHDLGLIAKTRETSAGLERGFAMYVGGGLGAVPHAAELLDEFVSERELFPMAQALCRVFGRLGEKQNRARARLKFVLRKLGIAELGRLVREERAKLRPDPRWTAHIDAPNALNGQDALDEVPSRPPGALPAEGLSEAFRAWASTNVRPQAQPGYASATVVLPLGDFTPAQARGVAELARRYSGGSMRLTVEQNLLLRWVSEADLPDLFAELAQLRLTEGGASTLTDVTSCPGTDTCKLGIASSRGLARELRRGLAVLADELPPAARALHIKCSGCSNSCGQHHVADLGFLGVSRTVGGRRVPHFQLVVGGQWENNGGAFGLAIGAVPAKRIPDVVTRLAARYDAAREPDEGFSAFIERIGKKELRAMLEDLMQVPSYADDPSYYSDWGDPREYTIGDLGVGECAGEVVPYVEMALAGGEREAFEAQLLLEEGEPEKAGARALSAMVLAARGLTRERCPDLGEGAEEIIAEFRARLVEPRLFHDRFEGAKFAQYLFRAQEEGVSGLTAVTAHQRIEEALLFIEAAHQCYERLRGPAS